jgi:hypothetical protein
MMATILEMQTSEFIRIVAVLSAMFFLFVWSVCGIFRTARRG